MKYAYATTFNAEDVSNWSGTPFYMSKAFAHQGIDIEYVGNLKKNTSSLFKLKQFWKSVAAGQRESPRFNIATAKYYSMQADHILKNKNVDAIIAPQIHPLCYLETKKPIVLWTDGLYASLIGFYPGFSSHSASSIKQGNIITRECLNRCSLAIFSSEWAARTAIEIYGIQKNKIKVVPFGANLENPPTLNEVKEMIQARSKKTIKFLFLGKHWDRKGGEIVFNTVNHLHKMGRSVELHFVGCYPPKGTPIPNYIHCHGFISKRMPEGIQKIKQLLRESHFLFVPSRAEAFGIVFCEANAFGLPCLTSSVGGISTIVKDNLNGITFGLDQSPEAYSDTILSIMEKPGRYEEMALTSFYEFESRLNWTVAAQTVNTLIESVI